jgi:hypothetical protein
MSQYVTDDGAQVLAVPETREFQEFVEQVTDWRRKAL